MSRKVPRLRWSFILAITTIVHLAFVAKLGLEGLGLFRSSHALEKRADLLEIEQPTLPPIHLIFTSSASYVTGLLALVNSTLVTASPATRARLQFHLVSSDRTEANQVVGTLAERFGAAVEGRISTYGLAEMEDERLEHVKVWAGYRSESLSKPIVFARFLIPDLLAPEIDRVIYLDQDVLVLKDLTALWEIDMEGYPIAAARLCRPSALWRKQFVMNKAPLIEGGYSHDTCTLNNGVLVYDLEAWRTSSPSFRDQLFHWTRLNSEDKLYSLGSQPPFNLVFYRNYKVLDDTWNLMDIAGLREESGYGHGQPWTRSRDEIASAAVLHWNGAIKPWMCNGEGYYSELWTAFFPDFRDFILDADVPEELCETLVITNPPAPPSVEQFTVVIVSFMRVDTVVKIVQHLQRSPYLREIVVAWNNLESNCPEELEGFPWVRCFQQEANLVSNRFLVWPNITTEAVLHYDDDLLAPLEDLEAAFQIWRRHRDQILGFEPRVILCDEHDDAPESDSPNEGQVDVPHLPIIVSGNPEPSLPKLSNCQYRFKLTDGYFDIVIGKLFFISRNFMQAYFKNVDLLALSTEAPCEDIGMNFLASQLDLGPSSPPAPRAPLLFKSNLTEIHSKLYSGLSQGISSAVWRGKRHECVQRLVAIFGAKPAEQRTFFERDEVRRRIYQLPAEGRLDAGWCSDTQGSRVCRQP